MEIRPAAFGSAFLKKARPLLAPGEVPMDGVELEASWAQPVQKVLQLLGGRSQERERQIAAAVRVAAGALGGPLALELARQVAVEQISPAQERESGQQFARQHGAQPLELGGLWRRVSAHSCSQLEAPQQLPNLQVGEGMFFGQSLFFDPQRLSRLPEEVQIFLLGHELGHVELRHSSQKLGMQWLQGQAGVDLGLASQEMEFAADRRAAEIAAREGCSPEPILREVLTWSGGKTHPEPIARAAAIRATMAEWGQMLEEGDWERLVAETEPARQAHAAEVYLAEYYRDLP